MQQISTSTDAKARKNVIHRISDIPGGIAIDLSTLVVGSIVPEASPLSAPSSGIRKLCKQAIILATSTTTAIKVESGTHHFKVDDIVTLAVGGKAYAITAIATASGVDTLTIGTAIDTPTEGAFIYESSVSAGEGADTGALENTADCILKEAFVAPTPANVVVQPDDGLLHAVVVEGSIAPLYLAQLKGVVEAKY